MRSEVRNRTSANKLLGTTGSSIKGQVKRKHTSPYKKIPRFFRLAPTSRTSTGALGDLRSKAADIDIFLF